MMQLSNRPNVLRFGKIHVLVGALARGLQARNSAKIVQKWTITAAALVAANAATSAMVRQ
jgi:hypothetical protein